MIVFKKSIAICLAVVSVFLSAVNVFAENAYLPDIGSVMEDIFRFDVGEFSVSEEPEEENRVENINQMQDLICKLGIMSYDAESFKGEDILTYDELYQAIYTLKRGENTYEPIGAEENVTVYEAARNLISVLGYDYLETLYGNDAWVHGAIDETNLLKGIEYNLNKFITRNEFGVMVSNALEADVAEYNIGGSVGTVEGKTILKKVFDVYKVTGILTAVDGVDLYGNNGIKNDIVKINRVEYMQGDENFNVNMLGRSFTAYVKSEDGTDRATIVNIYENENTSLEISLRDLETIDDNYLWYESDGKSRKIAVKNVNTIWYNGDTRNSLDFANEICGKNGILTLTRQKQNSEYEVALVKKYSDYMVKSVDTMQNRIKLEHGELYNGVEYIDVDNALENDKLTILDVNANAIGYSSIKEGTSISLIENRAKTYIEIIVSDKKVSGAITGIDENKITIDEEVYYISDEYLTAMGDPSNEDAPQMSLKLRGNFYISAYGNITGYKSHGEEWNYAYLHTVRKYTDDEYVEIKIYTADGEFVTYKLAEKTKIDGVKKLSYDKYDDIKMVEDTLIAYKLDDMGEVNALDTIYKTDHEDDKSMKYDTTVEGQGTTSVFTLVQKTGGNSNYHLSISEPLTLFVIPANKDQIKKFQIKNTIANGETIKLDIYNADRYMISTLGILRTSQNTYNPNSNQCLFVEKVNKCLVDDEIYYKVSGKEFINLRRPGQGSVVEATYYIDEATCADLITINDMYSNNANPTPITLAPGQLYNFEKDGEYIVGGTMIWNSDNPLTEEYKTKKWTNTQQWALGTIVAVDDSSKMLLISVNGTEYSFMMRAIGIVDRSEKEAYAATAGDFYEGEKVFVWGNDGHLNVAAAIRE